MSRKYALIIGNTEYADPGLAQLTAPGKDAEDFARVLKDKDIAAFDDVKVILDEPSGSVIEAIDEFFDLKKPDDLLVLYFSGHGIRDEIGSLYLAFKNTIRSRLRSTAIKSDYVREAMDQSRSKRQVLILDCCNSGAFPQGTKAELGGSMGMTQAFQGYGRFVLTASDATQFAWEGDKVIGETDNSLFTHFLVKGLEGEADSDGDGKITVDELYDYAYHEISWVTPKQTPTKSASKQEGEIILRQNMRMEDIRAVPLPAALLDSLENPFPDVRLGAVQQVARLLNGKNLGLARSAREALERIEQEDDSRQVSRAAKQALESIRQAEALAAQKEEEERRKRAEEDEEYIAKKKAEAQRLVNERAAEDERQENEIAEQFAMQKAEEEHNAKAEIESRQFAEEKQFTSEKVVVVPQKAIRPQSIPQQWPILRWAILGFIGLCIIASGAWGISYLAGLINPPATSEPQSSPAPTEPASPTAITCTDNDTKPTVSYLNYSTDLDKWGINYFRPASIDLSETPPASDWIEPSLIGIQRLYGILNFGDNTPVRVILDVLDEKESQIIFSFENDVDFTDNPVYKTTIGSVPEPIVFQAHYANDIDQKYAIHVYYPIDFAREIGAYRFHYYRGAVREGTIHLCNSDYKLAIADDNADGTFSDLDDTELLLDANRDSFISTDEQSSAPSSFLVDGIYYIISDISASGGRITVRRSHFGKITGLVTNIQTGKPIAGAKVQLTPLELSAVTDANGQYEIGAPEGVYSQISATAEGYSPNYIYIKRDQVVVDSKSLYLDTISLTPDTAVSARSGIIRLEQGDSYHFLTGERSQFEGGDFYFGFYDGKGQFLANNRFQQGLVDLGDIGDVSLDQVEIPDTGYYSFGVDAVLGHTYVSPAKEGEDGHYVVFRVIDIELDQYIEIEFYYR